MPEAPQSPSGSILIYSPAAGQIKVQIRLQNETLWLTQKAMAELFGVKIPAISKHLKNIFDTGELIETSVVSKMETVHAAAVVSILEATEILDTPRAPMATFSSISTCRGSPIQKK